MPTSPDATRAATVEQRAAERFLADTSEHQMTVLRDDGLYRHLRFQKPGTYCYGFDLITWPGYLAIAGDMGERMFSRTADMFQFFDSRTGQVNYDYWAEKVRPGGRRSVQEFSVDEYQAHVHAWLQEHTTDLVKMLDPEDPDPADVKIIEDLKEAVHEQLLRYEMPFDERDAVQRLSDFRHEDYRIDEPYEWDLTVYDSQYLWQCHAIVWGIKQYRKAAMAVLGGRELDRHDPLRANLPEAQRDSAEMYAVTVAGDLVGITDEYCTCHWAADGWTAERVTDLLLHTDGSPRE